MFAAAYFAPRYFARRYFPPALQALQGAIDRTDAGVGYTGQARRWLRRSGAYGSIKEALEAWEKQDKPKAKRKAREALRQVAESPDLLLRIAANVQEDAEAGIDIGTLWLILAKIEAFRIRDRQEEDALLALLLSI
jgi:hypothetical protein